MPQHKRGPWSQSEDQYLLHLVQIHGAHNWVRISSTIQTRSPKQCRERFHQNLKPNLNHDPITPEEGIMIEQMVAEMGKRWAEIARRLRGRSDNAVKNWWNGGMNRRRRSNNHRRADVNALHHPPQGPAEHVLHAPPPTQMHGLPSHQYTPHALPPQYFGQPIQPMLYHSGAPPPQPIGGPAGLYHRHPGMMVEPPLPSPSAFSQLSAESAPSLISDSSSLSARSPHHGASPIELPPIAGSRDDRRHSAAAMVRLGVPGWGVADGHYHASLPPQMKQAPHVLQEPFMPQQQQLQQQPQPQLQPSFPHPTHYLPSQPRHPSPMQHASMPQPSMSIAPPFLPRGHPYLAPQPVPSTPLQLPGISNLESPTSEARGKPGLPLDPASHPLGSTPDGSPKDKMSLSNLTH